MKKKVFKIGDLVFAKVRGYPAWPARVTGMTAGGKYSVFFYGTYEVANMKAEEMWPYNKKNLDKFGPPNLRKKGYSEGLYQIENSPDIAVQPVILGEGDFSGTFKEHVDQGSDPVLVKILSTNEIMEIDIGNDENNNRPDEFPDVKIECRIEVAEKILQNSTVEVDEELKQELKEKVDRSKEMNEWGNLMKNFDRLMWIKCERSVVDAICQIQKSITSHSDQRISNCLENLKLLESIELKPLMVIKMPVIFNVVKRLSTERITNSNDDIAAAEEVREISERIIQKIILDFCNGMPMSLSAFENVLDKKVIEFKSRTCGLSDKERMCLTNIVL